ncbi:MAG: sialate O-acetylesterase [Planctomycetes bacterium]|nr:sialate O-acetylesterase [Planctomycetota bacterium]
MFMRSALLILGIGFLPTLAQADVKPNALCSEGMVLQQKSKAKIWGTAEKGEAINVSFRDKTTDTKADDKGNWVVDVETGAAGGPFALTIKGSNTIAYKNVLVGEVWICSGQSNMEAKVGSYLKSDDMPYASAAAPNPMLRTFNVKRNPQTTPQTETAGEWIEASPKTVGQFTAVGYFFGRHLQENLKVPVGLIHTSWGGTRIEAWMSESALAPFEKANPTAKAGSPNGASQLYNGMIAPLLNYQVKGAIWYQGESNAGGAYKYRATHPAMVENWRADFRNPDLAFYFVQLAPFGATPKAPGESNWAELREAQNMTLKLKNTGMAVITDFGSEYDIHPTPKRPVGERLALAARAQTYGEKIVYSGPLYKSSKTDGNKIVLSFDHVGGGLVGKEMVPTIERKDKDGKVTGAAYRVKENSSANAPLTGFAICGKDKVFKEAKAEIVGETVVVSAEGVADPIAVRYGWANHPILNLFNREGLPASPFRTDEFPGITQPKK